MITGKNYKFWFCTGSQDLYGDECLRKVAEHSRIIVEELNKSGVLPFELVWKPTLITNELIRKTFNEANDDDECAGIITWMHTFSPAKSWILGLKEYRKPLCHLHTQFNEEIPYDTIDMDFMNETSLLMVEESMDISLPVWESREKSSSDTWLTRKYRRDWHPGCVPQSESWRAAISVYAVSLIT